MSLFARDIEGGSGRKKARPWEHDADPSDFKAG